MTILTRVQKPSTKLYSIKFVVEGRGQFPIDMLRYDQCYPDSQDDSAAIGDGYVGSTRRAVLCTDNVNMNWQPNVARWASFNWRVLSEGALDQPRLIDDGSTS
ncbi:MAG TPA: hypothetical protein VK634_19765 [Reyranella sp.]|nr:hypothetical protein [Reyranella sp.]HTE82933.1 hypothetical protein [Reyranella sp.]